MEYDGPMVIGTFVARTQTLLKDNNTATQARQQRTITAFISPIRGRPWIGVSLVQLALNSDICASNCKLVPYKITLSEAYISSLESNEW